jgi:hypothetical protein
MNPAAAPGLGRSPSPESAPTALPNGGSPLPSPFHIKDCSLTALATGDEAWNLRELRERVARAPHGTLYYHFWGRLLRPVFQHGGYNNDFADWAAHALRDPVLAERLALVDPGDYTDTEDLRVELLETIEDRLHDISEIHWVAPGDAFHFIHGRMVVFDTHLRLESPAAMATMCERLSRESLFYHFVDARHRSPHGHDDFQVWLREFGSTYEPLADALHRIDLLFLSLVDLRRTLTALCREELRQVDAP